MRIACQLVEERLFLRQLLRLHRRIWLSQRPEADEYQPCVSWEEEDIIIYQKGDRTGHDQNSRAESHKKHDPALEGLKFRIPETVPLLIEARQSHVHEDITSA